MKDIGIIIQARTGSSRLPNKMLLPYFNNLGIFELLLISLLTVTMAFYYVKFNIIFEGSYVSEVVKI